MSRHNSKCFLFILILVSGYVQAFNLRNFDSAGVYFKHNGELLVETDVYRLTTAIKLEPYHKAIELVKNTSLSYRMRCIQNDLNCDKEYNELMGSHTNLENRLNNIYIMVLERPVQRKKRFLGLIAGAAGIVFSLAGLGFGIANTVMIRNLSEEVDNMKKYMEDNFADIEKVIEKQGKVQIELKKQQDRINGILDIHEKKIDEIFNRIQNLEHATSELQKQINAIRMRVVFQNIRIDVLEILGKLRELEQWLIDLSKNSIHPEIMTPEQFTDDMDKYKLKSDQRYLAPPHLNNYNAIAETVFGAAYIVRDLKTIFISFRIPIYQKQKLNLYNVIEVPVIKNKKIMKISNNRNDHCVISEDTTKYECMNEISKFYKGKNYYFTTDVTDLSLLPTKSSRSCVIDIFLQKNLDNCRYKPVNANLEIVQEIDTHKYLFALRDKTKFNYDCKKTLEDGRVIQTGNGVTEEYLQNTGLLYLDSNCEFNTENYETQFKTSARVMNTWNENDVFNFEDIQEDVNDKFNSIGRTLKNPGQTKWRGNFKDIRYI